MAKYQLTQNKIYTHKYQFVFLLHICIISKYSKEKIMKKNVLIFSLT
jgi:hypothetical protein